MKRVIEYIKSNPGMMLAILACAIILFTTRGMLSKDLDQSGDLNYHLACEAEVARAIDEGRSPFGPISLNFGTPILKFYQPLFYLISGFTHAVTGIDVLLIHNFLIVFFFALTPFCLRWCFIKLGLKESTSGGAALLSLLSVGGFGNSFEAYFSLGVINQVMGAVFFPLFIGMFASLLNGKGGFIRAGVAFSLTFVAHVMMAAYAVFIGALLFLTERRDIRRIWRALVAFGILAILLVAFWFAPFLSLTNRFRPVPDVVARPHAAHFTNGLTPREATRLLFSGRLLDDARHLRDSDARTPDDILSDKMNLKRALFTRPPVLTIVVFLGFLLCLFRARVAAYRFLVAGFLFSFLLLMGADDVGWLRYLPFAKRFQFFRCTYLLEFFAFGLAAAGMEIGASYLSVFVRKLRKTGRRVCVAVTVLLLVTVSGYHLFLVQTAASLHVDPRSRAGFERCEQVARPAHKRFPLRMTLKGKRFRTEKRIMHYLGYRGYSTVCGHWRVMGPAIAESLCLLLHAPGKNVTAARMAGVGLHLVNRKTANLLNEVQIDGKKVLGQLKIGKGHYLYHDQGARYLWAATPAILIVANDTQWFYLEKAWLNEIGMWSRRGTSRNVPVTPVRLEPDAEIRSELLNVIEAVWILDPGRLSPKDRSVLAVYSNGGDSKVYSVAEIPDVETTRVTTEGPRLFDEMRGTYNEPGVKFERVAANVGGPFVYSVDSDRNTIVVLPQFAVPGWIGEVDGKPQDVFSAGPDFVGITVPKGRHEVRFEWHMPRLELVCLVISCCAWVMVLVVPLAFFIRNRRRK